MDFVPRNDPNFLEYDPKEIAWQYKLIKDVRGWDYDGKGPLEFLLSGSVGSGKSLPLVHLIATHCLFNPGANIGVGRRALPHLKATLLKKIRSHFRETNVTIEYNKTSGDIVIPRVGSMITALSWADGNYEKFGSHEFSCAAIEEGTETPEQIAYDYLRTRIGRLRNISESWLGTATNPDGPGHWIYKRFIQETIESRKVYYSHTEANPFLKRSYIESLKANLDHKRARRLLYGEWVEIDTERIYHAYSDRNFLKDQDYKVDLKLPVRISYDFNIAKGKPLSATFFQYIPQTDTFHFFDEVVIEGLRTRGSLEEAQGKGLLDHSTRYIIHGDAAGKHSDTRNNLSDYDIIKKYLNEYRQPSGEFIRFEVDVPLSNPSIRSRHNLVNAYCQNETGLTRLFLYKKAKTLDEGLRLTALKDKAQYIEDDSKPYQHITTACGYGVNSTLTSMNKSAPQMVARR